MATAETKARSRSGQAHELPLNRGARVGLLALLVLTIAFASGVLFIKYQLEAFRQDVAKRIEERFGARLSMGAISVNGLRGLRIENLRVDLPLKQGPVLHIHAPEALINIQLNDLVYGGLTVERLQLDGSEIILERPEGATWYSSDDDDLQIEELAPFVVSESVPFRITGAGCHLYIRNIVGGTSLDVSDFDFDASKLAGSKNLSAALQGFVSGDPRKRVSATLTLASIEDFDLRVTSDLITANDINVILPADRPLIVEGAAHPTLRVSGLADRTLVVLLQSSFENLLVRDQPEFLDPAAGDLTVVATYSADSKRLTVSTAKADSNQIAGTVEGAISFAESHPVFDLTLHARRIPLREILLYSLEGEMEDIGRMDILLDESNELAVTLTGNSQEPVIRGHIRAGTGRFEFDPNDEDLPPIQLALRQIEGAWDSYTQDISLEFDVADGAIEYEPLRVSAQGLQGHVTLKDNVVSFAPMNAQYRGNTIVGGGEYDLISGDGTLRFEGTVAGLDETLLADKFADTTLAGAVYVKGEAQKKGETLIVDAYLDATQADITYQWWLKKAAGMGATGHIHAVIVPDSKASVKVTAGRVASSDLSAEMTLTRKGKKDPEWSVDYVRATSDNLDVNTAATFAVVPYRATGGTVSKAYFEFTRDPEEPLNTTQKFGGVADDLALLPDIEGATIPLSGRGVELAFELHTDKSGRSKSTGAAQIAATSLSVPPFGTTWMLPIAPPPGWPRVERAWSLDISAAEASVPPWAGTDLFARAYSDGDNAGFNPYRAKIGEGTLEGSYDAKRADHTYVAAVTWADVPAHFFLEHLKMPAVLDGNISGNVRYSVDQDDPNTLEGKGHFDVRDGRFSADFLYELLEGSVQTDITTIPPKLDFSRLSADVEFAQDTVKTPTLVLNSETINVDGSGQYIRNGDMDYRLKVAVDPDTAAQIPVMADNFNIEGHRISNMPIELTFHVTGPTFKPRGKVEELPPASVALVSGGLEVGREVVSLIDFPRKILVDLLKLGGGVLRGGRNRDAQEKPSAP